MLVVSGFLTQAPALFGTQPSDSESEAGSSAVPVLKVVGTTPRRANGQCTDISGTWALTERLALTCTVSAQGQSETGTDTYNAAGTVTIAQDPGSCSFR